MMISPDRLSEIESIVSYKYFGDYEFTDEQRLAVRDLLDFAKEKIGRARFDELIMSELSVQDRTSSTSGISQSEMNQTLPTGEE